MTKYKRPLERVWVADMIVLSVDPYLLILSLIVRSMNCYSRSDIMDVEANLNIEAMVDCDWSDSD